jgi:hypothetical protein
MKIEERIDMYIGEAKSKKVKFPRMNNLQLLKVKHVFKNIMEFGDNTIDKNSFTIDVVYSKDVEIAKSYKLVTTTQKAPKGMYGYENLKDEERMLVYPTQLGLHLMAAMQQHKELRTDKRIKL